MIVKTVKKRFKPASCAAQHLRRSGFCKKLKDEFGARHVYVQGPTKVMSHLMFGVLALSADQFIRLRR